MGNSLTANKSVILLERQTIALERIAEYLDRETSFAKYLANERKINSYNSNRTETDTPKHREHSLSINSGTPLNENDSNIAQV